MTRLAGDKYASRGLDRIRYRPSRLPVALLDPYGRIPSHMPGFSDMYYAAWYYLGVDVFIVALQAISLIGNGFIIYLFLT